MDWRPRPIGSTARSRTNMHKRTEMKQRVRALREQLPIEGQTLLILHVDRGLP